MDADKSKLSNNHILVVDNDIHVCHLIQAMFFESYQVTLAMDGTEAISVLEDKHFDAVLLDVMMPQISGLDVLEHIRSHPDHNDLPVLLLSAATDAQTIKRGFELGANDYLTKPITRDIAQARVQAQIDLHNALIERDMLIKTLEDQKAARERLTRMVTHDLKHPLGNIRMAENLLRGHFTGDKQGQAMLDSIALALEASEELLGDFSDAYSVTGDIKIELESVSLNGVVSDVALRYLGDANRKQIELHVDKCLLHVHADKSQLRRVVSNLVSNAIKYSPHDGDVYITAVQKGDMVRLSVTDQGAGIPAEEQQQLYTEFGRLSTRPTGQETSTGLGLWIVKTLIETMGGQVGYEQAATGGAVFWMELPDATAATQASETLVYPNTDQNIS
jgi:two-component system, sensor histidine kinase and response regulator